MAIEITDQIPSVFWNALFEFHRSICDQTIETSVLLTKVEELCLSNGKLTFFKS
jgi:hypothetical protein